MLIALPFTSAISCWYLHKDIPNPEMFDAKAISFHPPPRCAGWSFTCNTPSGARQRMWCLQPSKRWKSQLYYFLVVTAVKNLPTMLEMQGDVVQSLYWENPLEEELATLPRVLAWRIPWTEEPGGLQSIGSQRVVRDWAHMHGNLNETVSSIKANWFFPPRTVVMAKKDHVHRLESQFIFLLSLGSVSPCSMCCWFHIPSLHLHHCSGKQKPPLGLFMTSGTFGSFWHSGRLPPSPNRRGLLSPQFASRLLPFLSLLQDLKDWDLASPSQTPCLLLLSATGPH